VKADRAEATAQHRNARQWRALAANRNGVATVKIAAEVSWSGNIA